MIVVQLSTIEILLATLPVAWIFFATSVLRYRCSNMQQVQISAEWHSHTLLKAKEKPVRSVMYPGAMQDHIYECLCTIGAPRPLQFTFTMTVLLALFVYSHTRATYATVLVLYKWTADFAVVVLTGKPVFLATRHFQVRIAWVNGGGRNYHDYSRYCN